jgi:exopolysaccharide biosynthesis polyprenyl glycosylphosphotransferase
VTVHAGPGSSTPSQTQAENQTQTKPTTGRGTSPDVVPDLVWASAYASILVVVDCIAIFLGLVTAYFARFAGAATPNAAPGLSYVVILVVAGPLWLGLLVVHRCYDARMFGFGPAEFRRVVLASIRLFGGTALVCFMAKLSLSRAFLAAALLVGLSLLLLGRYGTRRWLHRKRRNGEWCRRVVAVGLPAHVDELARVLAREPVAGYAIVGGCFPGVEDTDVTPGGVPSLGPITGVVNAARAAQCDTIAVTASPGITNATLRRLAWDLEGSGIALVVAPALTDVAGPRISIQPVAGLPLLHVDEPALGALHRTVKRVMDLTLTTLALILLAPLFVVITAVIALTSRGPVIFRQTRVGRGGGEFVVYKFRSMHVDAEARLAQLKVNNDAAGPLFKLRADPRVTAAGRWLRRFSLDELPQLWNVLKGDMSLVGPRPPLPREVARYEDDVRRRLLVKPGITGLWQVSGRSDLSWDDSVRLDLYYVENWSPVLDAVILVRTVVAVVRGIGAY